MFNKIILGIAALSFVGCSSMNNSTQTQSRSTANYDDLKPPTGSQSVCNLDYVFDEERKGSNGVFYFELSRKVWPVNAKSYKRVIAVVDCDDLREKYDRFHAKMRSECGQSVYINGVSLKTKSLAINPSCG